VFFQALSFPLVAPIHLSAWKRNSANFAFTEFSEIALSSQLLLQ
jgi:hypothetical protein